MRWCRGSLCTTINLERVVFRGHQRGCLKWFPCSRAMLTAHDHGPDSEDKASMSSFFCQWPVVNGPLAKRIARQCFCQHDLSTQAVNTALGRISREHGPSRRVDGPYRRRNKQGLLCTHNALRLLEKIQITPNTQHRLRVTSAIPPTAVTAPYTRNWHQLQ